ncbi:flagellar basal body P-ring formation chaperone FlgA [Scandinavium manionii]|uniref:flagellar basal body P-ring formation chaperone FlgA n=1 Tax=Scandinavium manionii TaxID=2926520 RepID=UPI001358B13F|nr:flagellar basal body P-ring formation chaperone FlgA [Scandinavium manionii]MCS2166929.1 flagellar basal body P-ring formation chaperone FlgA [Scandinavium manionii]
MFSHRSGGKVTFRCLCVAFFACLFVAPAQATAKGPRAQINALVLSTAGKDIDKMAQKKGWQDYHYKLNVFIPSYAATETPCGSALKATRSGAELVSVNRISYDVSCPGSQGWHLSVPVHADLYVPVVMVNGVVERGEVLDESQLVLKSYNISNAHGDLLTRLDQVLGLTSKRTLRPGKPVIASQLEMPELVKRDQSVMLQSQLGGITAQTAAIAMKNGRKGDTIKVRNESSQRIVSAIVIDQGVVKTLNSE